MSMKKDASGLDKPVRKAGYVGGTETSVIESDAEKALGHHGQCS